MIGVVHVYRPMASMRRLRVRSLVAWWSSQAVSSPAERASLRVMAWSMGGGGGGGGGGFAVGGVSGAGEVEVVGGLAAGDVDVGFGAGGGGVDAAGGDCSGSALDGVGGDRVGVVKADVSSPASGGGAVSVEV